MNETVVKEEVVQDCVNLKKIVRGFHIYLLQGLNSSMDKYIMVYHKPSLLPLDMKHKYVKREGERKRETLFLSEIIRSRGIARVRGRFSHEALGTYKMEPCSKHYYFERILDSKCIDPKGSHQALRYV